MDCDSFSSMKLASPGKNLLGPLSNDSPHICHLTKADTGISSWIFLKVSKPAFNIPPPSQNGLLVSICAVQHVWRLLRKVGFKYLET
jgi:hypothetical protein